MSSLHSDSFVLLSADMELWPAHALEPRSFVKIE